MVNVHSKLLAMGAVLAAAGNADARLGDSRALSAEKVTSIGNAFNGIDILTFEPDNPLGPSLRSMIFEGVYDDGRQTADGKWLVPDGTNVVEDFRCDVDASATTVTGESSYSKMTNTQVTFKAGFGIGPVDGSMSNSDTFKDVSEGTNSYGNMYTFTEMVCKLYKIQLQPNNLPPFTKDFAMGIQNLRNMLDPKVNQSPDAFVESYGTHYLVSSSLGSKYTKSTQSTREQTSMLQSSTTSIEAGAEVSALGQSAGTDILNEQEQTEKESFEELSTQFHETVLGARVPTGTTQEEVTQSWIDNTLNSNSLSLISDYEFAGLDNLFVPDMLDTINKNLKNQGISDMMTAAELQNVHDSVVSAIEGRCKSMGYTCDRAGDDVPLPQPAQVQVLPNDFAKGAYPNDRGGAQYEASDDVGKLFGHSGKQTADMYVSKLQFWFKTDTDIVHQGTKFLEGVRVFYKDSKGNENPTPISGDDSGELCEVTITKDKPVGSIDIRTGTYVDYIEIRSKSGDSLISCGNNNGGDLNSVTLNPDENFNGFFGWYEANVDNKYIYSIGAQKTKLQVDA